MSGQLYRFKFADSLSSINDLLWCKEITSVEVTLIDVESSEVLCKYCLQCDSHVACREFIRLSANTRRRIRRSNPLHWPRYLLCEHHISPLTIWQPAVHFEVRLPFRNHRGKLECLQANQRISNRYRSKNYPTTYRQGSSYIQGECQLRVWLTSSVLLVIAQSFFGVRAPLCRSKRSCQGLHLRNFELTFHVFRIWSATPLLLTLNFTN